MRSQLLILSLLIFAAAPARAAECRHKVSIISWNVQTFGNIKPERRAVAAKAYRAVFSTAVAVAAIQEIASRPGLDTFMRLIPGATAQWSASFDDTSDSQDNAIVYRSRAVRATASGFLFTKDGKPDFSKAVHPVRWTHIYAGGFDFTLLSLHLTFKEGQAEESKKELYHVLDWLRAYLKDPENDKDVIIAGDFNLPSDKGKILSARARDGKWLMLNSMIREYGGQYFEGDNALYVLVDDPTSRPQKKPANNYDHFILTKSAFKRLLGVGRAPIRLVDAADAASAAKVSDHYPISATFCADPASGGFVALKP